MFPIDVVICWVDGNDPNWRHQKESLSSAEPLGDNGPTRYTNNDELKYCLRSIAKNAPWVHHVWIITAGQTPSWWVASSWASLVDHKVILPLEVLPTFNSFAIESCMHRIPGLSEHFIYLNDDFFFGKPVLPSDFFASDGLMVHQWGLAIIPCKPLRECQNAYHHAVTTTVRLLLEVYPANMVGQIATIPPHHAIPKTIAFCEKAWLIFPEAMEWTREQKFRRSGMIIHYLVNYLAMLQKKVHHMPRMNEKVYETFEDMPLHEALPTHLCINKVNDSAAFVQFMSRHFPICSAAEGGNTTFFANVPKKLAMHKRGRQIFGSALRV